MGSVVGSTLNVLEGGEGKLGCVVAVWRKGGNVYELWKVAYDQGKHARSRVYPGSSVEGGSGGEPGAGAGGASAESAVHVEWRPRFGVACSALT